MRIAVKLTMRIAVNMVTNMVTGLIFGLGLLISGMANPAKVQNFLDVAGTFDPSLICVMLGAVVADPPRLSLSLQEAKTGSRRAVLSSDSKGCRWESGARRGTIWYRLGPVRQSPRFHCWLRARSSLCLQCSLALAWHVF